MPEFDEGAGHFRMPLDRHADAENRERQPRFSNSRRMRQTPAREPYS